MGRKFAIYRAFTMYPELKLYYKLTYDHFAVLESIRYLSTSNPDYKWCITKKEEIARYCAVSRSSVFRAVENGIQKKLLERHPDNSEWIRTTKEYNETLLGLRELRGQSQFDTKHHGSNKADLVGQSQIGIHQSQNEISQSQNETTNNRMIKMKNKQEKQTAPLSFSQEDWTRAVAWVEMIMAQGDGRYAELMQKIRNAEDDPTLRNHYHLTRSGQTTLVRAWQEAEK